MNRLSTRLVIAMMLTALVSSIILIASQFISQELYIQSLPPEVQAVLQQRRSSEGNQALSLGNQGSRQSSGQGGMQGGSLQDNTLQDSVQGAEQGTNQANRLQPNQSRRSQLFQVLRLRDNIRQVQRRSMLLGTLIATLVASLFAVLLARRISKPIEGVTQASLELAKGDLSARVIKSTGDNVFGNVEVAALSENFNHMASSLETYEKERTDMIASIAHDLRTPLTVMQIRLEALQEGLVDFNQSEVTLLLSQTEVLNRLISDLRTLSLADAGKLSLNMQVLSLNDLLSSVVDNYDLQARKRGVRLELHTPQTDSPDLPAILVFADSQRMTQVLGNLMTNALEATPPEGIVSLELSQNNQEAIISVKDTGSGIPDELIEQVFDRFIHGKDKTDSSGLGLAIVKTLVDLQGGKVTALNQVNAGACFQISMPIVK